MSIDVIGTQIDHTEQAPVVLGSEKIPTGGRGLYHVTVDQVRDYVLTYFGKEAIRLGEVDNTSDEDKPLSRATREALSKKLDKSGQFVRSINGLTGDIDLVPTVLGLGNVDNTSDKDKPLSEAAVRALSTKLDKVTFKDFKRVFHIFEQQVYDKFTKLDEIDTQLLNRVSQLEEADIEITKTLQDLTKYLNRELARISSTLSEEQMKIVSNYLGANFDNLLKTSSWLPLRLNKLHQDILVSINVVRAITDNLAVNDTNLKNQLDSLIVQLNSRISKINEDLSNINSKVYSNENVINRQFVEAREYFDQQINGLLPLIQGAADKYLKDLSDFQQTVDDVTRNLHNSVANVQTQINDQSVVTESLNKSLNSKHDILLDMMASQGKTLEDLIDSATQSARNDMRDLGYRMQELDYNYERSFQNMEGILETQVESAKQLVKKQVAQVNSDIEAVKNLATTLEDQAQALADNYETRLTEVTEATLLDITEILQDSLQQETLERNQAILDAVLKESHDRADAIKLESTARNNAIEAKVSEINSNIATQINSVQDGINKEVIDRTNDIATVRGEINSYKSSNDTAVATALQKIETITTDYNSTVTALDSLHSTFSDLSTDLSEVTSDLSTFKQTVADADNALASSVNTLATTLQNNNTEVNGRITGVETSVTTLEENVNTKTSQLQSSLDTTQGSVNEALEAISTKADANTVDTLESKVTSIDGKVTSQGSSITELTNDLTITKEKVDTKADSSALSSLTNEVTSLDGKILAQSNAITNLQSQTTNIENSLETKVEATALSDYYTKAETDTISAGKLEEFKAGLKLGGTNLIPNSNLFSVGVTSDQNLLREILSNGNLKITNKGVTLQTYLDHFYDASTTFDELLKLQDGDDFTTSVWVKAVNVDSLPTVLPLLYFSDLLSYEEMEGDLTQLSSGKEVVYTQTRKFVKGVTNISPHFQLSHHSVGGGIIITKWQIEKGTLASDWSPSNQEVRDILNANTTAINITNTETSRINELVTTQGSSISSLEGNLQLVDAKLGVAITNAAIAQSTANTAINNVESTADSLNKLSSKFEVSALAANNLLINSNESKEYDGTYPHHVYMLTEPWEVDATYTLLWCAEHRQNDNEPYSFLSVYAGGGLQDVQMLRQTGGKVVSKTTFIKTNSGLSPEIHFYLLNQPSVSEGTVATVYWAVLVKGDTITTDRWIPSSKEYIPQLSVTNANITTLSRTLTDADTALSRRIDTLTSSVNNDNEVISGKINDVASSVSTLDGNTTTKFTTLESNVSALENNVAKKLDATIIDDYYTKTESNSAISGQLTQFKASLDIGGTNLLLNTQYLSKELPPTIVGGSSLHVQGISENYAAAIASGESHFVINNISDERFIRLTADVGINNTLKPNSTYTFSLKVRGAAKPLKFRMIAFLPTGWVDLEPLSDLDYVNDVFSKHSHTFTIPVNSTRFILSLQSDSPKLGESFAILNSSMKLEEGTVATTWSPAPGDVQDSLKSNSIAINTVNTEVARVGNIVTTQSTSISKLQSDLSELDTKTGQAITNAATAQQTANTAVTNDKATSDRVDALTTTVANNNTTVTGKINDVVTSVTTLEGNTNSKISSLESSLSIISSVITISSAIDILKDLTITDESPGEITKVTDLTATGGQVLSVGNNTGNDCVWARSTQALTIDPNRMYRLRARLRLIAGTGYIYLGVGCLTADKSNYVNTYNSVGSSLGSSNYLLESARPPTDTWVTYEYFLQGKSTGPVTGSGTIQDPRTFAPLAAFASPMFIVNYPSTSGTVEIDYITLEIADDLKETRGTSTALASLTSQVNTVDGNVVTLSNDLTTLKGTTTALENNVAKKLDASVINNYFTKTEADKAVAGAINNYNAQLIIGANNLFTGTQEWLGTWTNIWAYEKTNDYYKGLRVLRTVANWTGVHQGIMYDDNVQYTISAWIKKSQADVAIHFWGDNLSGDSGAGTHKPTEPGVWTRVTHTFKGTGQVGTARFEKVDNGSTGSYDICGLKVERGNKATDWSPNPKDEVNALVLGGRNLFTKTTEFQLFAGASNAYRQDTGFVVTGVVANDAVLRLWKMNMPAGICTVSFDHYIATGSFQMYVDASDGPRTGFVVESAQGWQHFELQFLVTNSVTDGWLDISGLTGQPHTFKNFKVEKGSKATDYTPAPEDVASDINKVQANLTNFQEAQANVDLAQTNRLNAAESQLGANTARITNVEQTYATRDGVAALARNALQAEWQTYANDSVNNLQIGGINLVKLSAGKFQPMHNSVDNYQYNMAFALLEKNQTYTLSAKTNGVFTANHDPSSESNKAVIWIAQPDGGNLQVKSDANTGTTGTVFTWYGESGWCGIRINGYKADNSTWVSNIQIERGTKRTDWKPSPWDSEWQLVENADLNNLKTTAKIFVQGGATNAPIQPWFYLTVEKATDGRVLQQVIKDNSPSENWTRYYFDGGWSEWVKSVTLNELNAFKSTAETIYSTRAEANSTTADIINRLTSKANQSGLDALSADVANNYYTKAQTDSVTAGVVNSYKAELGNIINYTVVSRGNESGGMGYILNAQGNWIVGGSRSYTLVVFNSDGTINWSRNYDIFGNPGLNQAFYDDINALANGVYVVIFTSDEPASNRNPDLIFPALKMLGGTREVNDKLGYRGSYMLIGRKGMVEGTAVELVAPANQIISYGLQFVNGVPVGIGNTPTAMPSQFASASAVQNIQAEVGNINGQVSSQAYSITELRSDLDKVGSTGPNLLKNSDFSNKNTDYWGWENTDNVYVANNLNWEYALSSAGDSRYVVAQGWNSMELYQFVPVEGNKIYQVSAHVASHRSSVKIYVSWWGKDMSYLGYTGDNVAEWSKNGDGAPQALGGSSGLVGTRRIYQNNIAPPNAYYMKVTLGRSSGNDPYMWATRLNAVEINSLTTPIIPWGESGAGLGVKLTETTQSINGIEAVKTVTIDNNGVMSGYGLISQLKNGQVTSAFGINADQFYIGAPSSGKKPFTVLTSPGTVNGIPVPAGTYIDTAYIADATITSAKIQELNGAKITAGSIKAEQLSVQSLSALNAKIGTITTTGSQGSMTISDSLIEIRDSSGKIRVRLGIW